MFGPPCVVRSRSVVGLWGRFFVYVDIIHQIYLAVNMEIQIYLVSFLHWESDFYSVLYAHIFASLSMRSKHRLRPCARDTNLPIKQVAFLTFTQIMGILIPPGTGLNATKILFCCVH